MEKIYTARIKMDDVDVFLNEIVNSRVLAADPECSESSTGAHVYVATARRWGGRGNNNFNCKYCGIDPHKDESGDPRLNNENTIQQIKDGAERFIARYDPEKEWDAWILGLMASQLINLNAIVDCSVSVDDTEIGPITYVIYKNGEKSVKVVETYDELQKAMKQLRNAMRESGEEDAKIKYEIYNFRIGPAIFNPG
jgi:hypothetical protein